MGGGMACENGRRRDQEGTGQRWEDLSSSLSPPALSGRGLDAHIATLAPGRRSWSMKARSMPPRRSGSPATALSAVSLRNPVLPAVGGRVQHVLVAPSVFSAVVRRGGRPGRLQLLCQRKLPLRLHLLHRGDLLSEPPSTVRSLVRCRWSIQTGALETAWRARGDAPKIARSVAQSVLPGRLHQLHIAARVIVEAAPLICSVASGGPPALLLLLQCRGSPKSLWASRQQRAMEGQRLNRSNDGMMD